MNNNVIAQETLRLLRAKGEELPSGVDNKLMQKVVMAVREVITSRLAEGEKVHIRGLGSLVPYVPSRTRRVRNWATGEMMDDPSPVGIHYVIDRGLRKELAENVRRWGGLAGKV